MSRRPKIAIAVVEKPEETAEDTEVNELDELEAECQAARDKLYAARLRLGL